MMPDTADRDPGADHVDIDATATAPVGVQHGDGHEPAPIEVGGDGGERVEAADTQQPAGSLVVVPDASVPASEHTSSSSFTNHPWVQNIVWAWGFVDGTHRANAAREAGIRQTAERERAAAVLRERDARASEDFVAREKKTVVEAIISLHAVTGKLFGAIENANGGDLKDKALADANDAALSAAGEFARVAADNVQVLLPYVQAAADILSRQEALRQLEANFGDVVARHRAEEVSLSPRDTVLAAYSGRIQVLTAQIQKHKQVADDVSWKSTLKATVLVDSVNEVFEATGDQQPTAYQVIADMVNVAVELSERFAPVAEMLEVLKEHDLSAVHAGRVAELSPSYPKSGFDDAVHTEIGEHGTKAREAKDRAEELFGDLEGALPEDLEAVFAEAGIQDPEGLKLSTAALVEWVNDQFNSDTYSPIRQTASLKRKPAEATPAIAA